MGFFDWVRGDKTTIEEAPKEAPKRKSLFSTDEAIGKSRAELERLAYERNIQKTPANFKIKTVDDSGKETIAAMDNASQMLKGAYQFGFNGALSDGVLGWFANIGFIGYSTCAILAQNKIIDKICLMPAQDAARNGYDITNNDGQKIDVKIFDAMKKLDNDFNVHEAMIDFVHKGNIYGIRLALFLVNSDDLQYYEKPFNIDGVTEGSYKGISLIDPIWVAPELSMDAASRPDAQDFYEPTWWVINGKKIHRTHFAIYRTGDLPDQLKPTYLFGGIPLPQQIFERVYAAERTANEAPQLAMTKRLTTLKMNTIAMGAQEGGITENVQLFTQMRDNYGVHVLGEEEDIQQFDISLADLDATIMTQYQLCAMIGELPATKLLGTTPKGFNATGEYDAKSYQEKLQGIQKNKLTKLVQRHHELIIKSIIMPKYGIDYFRTELVWKPIDTPTFEEVSKIQKSKAETYKTLFEVGAVDDLEIRSAVIKDPDSGFNGLDSELPPDAKPHGQEAAGG